MLLSLLMQPSEKIKEKLDLVDFVKSYVELKPAGRNWKGRCPFHSEKTPSFIVSKDRQIWHCFGCGKGGDIFKFLMEFENLEFREALKILAEKAGIELKSMNPEEYRQFGVLYDINNAAKDFYVENFTKFPVAKNYLLNRRLKPEVMDEFEIGFAPNDFDATTTHLIKKGFKVDDIIRAGVSFKSDAGRVGDRFRGRIMFPIHDHSGKVIAFSGRILPELEDKTDMGKYVNSPETLIYQKSKILYGFWRTKKDIRDSRTAVLVEGQMDFLMSYQSGLKNIIATSGTALTSEHLKVLKPIADKIIISFDNDSAGVMAAERAIDLLGESDFNVAILHLGSHKDPADAAISDPAFLINAAANAKSALNFYFERYLSGDLAREKKNIRAVLAKIKKLGSAIERAAWLRELSHLTGIKESDLREEMDALQADSSRAAGGDPNARVENKINISKAGERREKLAEKVLSLTMLRTDLLDIIPPYLGFFPSSYLKAYKAIHEAGESDAQIAELINFISLRSGMETSLEKEDQEEELVKLLSELELEHLKIMGEAARAEILSAESEGDEERLIETMRRFDDTMRKMQNIKNRKKA